MATPATEHQSGEAPRLPRARAVLVANDDWIFYNFRRPLAALRAKGFEVLLVSPPGPFADRMQGEGFAFHPWKTPVVCKQNTYAFKALILGCLTH